MDGCVSAQFWTWRCFLTVTPDDKKSFLVTAYAGIDNCAQPGDVENVTAETLRAKAKEHKEI